MKYLTFNNISIPVSCITGLSYSRSGNIVNSSNLSCKCLGINNIQVQLQITLNAATCYNDDFMTLARQLSQIRPNSNTDPSKLTVGDTILVPQLEFMLISTNLTYQSDRNSNLQQLDISWTLAGSRVVKDVNRNTELSHTTDNQLPKITLHCHGESVDCSKDINIASLRLSGFKGHIELLLADTYKGINKDAWLIDTNNSDDTYFEITGYGKFYITHSDLVDTNWLSFELTKFSKSWYKKITKTLISDSKSFNLSDVFPDATNKSLAKFGYYKYDSKPIEAIYDLQDSLGYLVGLRGDEIVLYDPPESVPVGQATYDYILDSDELTFPFSKVIIRDGLVEYEEGDDTGETFFEISKCRCDQFIAKRVLNYIKFNQNMITMTIPYESRINIGSIVNINTNNGVIHCVITEYDIDFLSNSMQLELHYVNR